VKFVIAILGLCSVTFVCQSQSETGEVRQEKLISYSLRYSEPGTERIRITIALSEPPTASLTLIMPRAIPMGYGEQYFDRYVESVAAFSNSGEPLPVERVEGPRWKIGRDGSRLERLEYEVNLARMEREIYSAADSSKIRTGYVGLLGYSIFGFLEGFESHSISLKIDGPSGWPIFSTLDPRVPPVSSAFTVQAANFYALADSQIALGPKLQVQRLPGTVSLFVAFYTEGEVDIELEGKLSLEAMERLVAYFGNAPFKHYTVHVELLRPVSPRHSYGFSMEHLDSSTYYLGLEQGLTSKSTPELRERVRFNRAHHIAHSWVPKRAYGEGYFPFNWELAPLIDTIWLSEGFVRYVAIQALTAGMTEAEAKAYKQRQLDSFRRILTHSPVFIRRMSLVDLSRVGSTRYSEDFRTGRNLFSRGALMAAEMDEHIRESSRGKKSFRDAMRYLMTWSQRTGRAFKIEELPLIMREGTGVDTRKILERWLQPLDR
jgi:predicted metalloprotease with PDZ domain